MIDFFSLGCIGIVSTLLCCGCNALPGDDNDMERNATAIIEIRAVPNPVLVADTVHIHCTHRDSLETGFTFNWILSTEESNANVFDTNTCKTEWIAPSIVDEYTHVLMITRNGYKSVREEFNISVIAE